MRGATNRGIAALTAALVAPAIMVTPMTGQEQVHPASAIEDMVGFLTAWVVDRDGPKAMSYLGASAGSLDLVPKFVLREGRDNLWKEEESGFAHGFSKRSTVPVKIATGYWTMLNAFWPARPVVDVGLEYFLVVNNHAYSFVKDELHANPYNHGSMFTVFAADEPVEVNSFDAGYGDVATVLKPSPANPVLTMIADFRDRRSFHPNVGPFVSFWGEEGQREWRIQALGAFPPQH